MRYKNLVRSQLDNGALADNLINYSTLNNLNTIKYLAFRTALENFVQAQYRVYAQRQLYLLLSIGDRNICQARLSFQTFTDIRSYSKIQTKLIYLHPNTSPEIFRSPNTCELRTTLPRICTEAHLTLTFHFSKNTSRSN